MRLEDHPWAFLASFSRYRLSISTLPVVRLYDVLLVAECLLSGDELLEVQGEYSLNSSEVVDVLQQF